MLYSNCRVSEALPYLQALWGKEKFWANSVMHSIAGHFNPVTLYYLGIDYDFIPSYEIKILAGRNFSKDFPSYSSAAILNETAVRMLGFASPEQAIHQKIGSENGIAVIGVVQDYHTERLHKAIDPQLIILRPNARNAYSIKLESANLSSAIAAIKAKWNTYFPNDPFNYYFFR